MAGVIKTLKNILKTKNIYPTTVTKAVYDNDGNRLDNTLNKINQDLVELNNNLENKRYLSAVNDTLRMQLEDSGEINLWQQKTDGTWSIIGTILTKVV